MRERTAGGGLHEANGIDGKAVDARLRKALSLVTETRNTCREVAHGSSQRAEENRVSSCCQKRHARRKVQPLKESVHREACRIDPVDGDSSGLGFECRPEQTFQKNACLL